MVSAIHIVDGAIGLLHLRIEAAAGNAQQGQTLKDA